MDVAASLAPLSAGMADDAPPTSLDAPLALGYRPSAPAAPPAKPLHRIKQALLGAKLRREEDDRRDSNAYSLPAILASIEAAKRGETEAHARIEEARARLMAPPPDAPTHPEPNVGETIGGTLAALFAGGGLGAGRAVSQTMDAAWQRQGAEFANRFRGYQHGQERRRDGPGGGAARGS